MQPTKDLSTRLLALDHLAGITHLLTDPAGEHVAAPYVSQSRAGTSTGGKLEVYRYISVVDM
jgi:hypothetical protein